MLSILELAAVLLTVTATFAWVNHRLIGLPINIGLLIMGLCVSLAIIVIKTTFPEMKVADLVSDSIRQIDFHDTVMHGMLAFLLFAGALHVNIEALHSRAVVVGILATVGVLIAMMLVASGIYFGGRVLSLPISFPWCLVFGALIAPTDPVAVLTTLGEVDVPKSLETDMSGEALFNDGIAVVLFTIALQAATSGSDFGVTDGLKLLLIEAGGGAVLGAITGYIAYGAMRAIDDYPIEVMISLALVTATYAAADRLGISGPISVVVAGVLIGNRGAAFAMSELTKRYVFGFWTLIDETLNAVLFLLIGLEVLVLGFDWVYGWIALVAVPLAVAARFISVTIPIAVLRRWVSFVPGTVRVLTWGGVRGGISIALALSLPAGEARPVILAATYAIVLFSVIVQGLTFGRVVTAATGAEATPGAERVSV